MLLARHTAHWLAPLHAEPRLYKYMYGMLFAQASMVCWRWMCRIAPHCLSAPLH